jgi:CPA1 family monovalent cation:H+ antiporter
MIDIITIGRNLILTAIAFLATLVARALSSYAIPTATTNLTKETIPVKWRHVAMLGSMRGSISVAFAASLPENEFKNMLLSITFGVVLSSLIIQYVVFAEYTKNAFGTTEIAALDAD